MVSEEPEKLQITYDLETFRAVKEDVYCPCHPSTCIYNYK